MHEGIHLLIDLVLDVVREAAPYQMGLSGRAVRPPGSRLLEQSDGGERRQERQETAPLGARLSDQGLQILLPPLEGVEDTEVHGRKERL
jgi:hypothetical protein